VQQESEFPRQNVRIATGNIRRKTGTAILRSTSAKRPSRSDQGWLDPHAVRHAQTIEGKVEIFSSWGPGGLET
jgi:hypothetical protein